MSESPWYLQDIEEEARQSLMESAYTCMHTQGLSAPILNALNSFFYLPASRRPWPLSLMRQMTIDTLIEIMLGYDEPSISATVAVDTAIALILEDDDTLKGVLSGSIVRSEAEQAAIFAYEGQLQVGSKQSEAIACAVDVYASNHPDEDMINREPSLQEEGRVVICDYILKNK